MPAKEVSRDDAAAVLRRGHDEVARLVARLTEASAARPGLGGGDWSAKDLLGHLTSWEEHALAALDAWSRGRAAPIDQALRRDGLDAVNLAEVRSKQALPYEQIRGDFEAVHASLLLRIGAMTDAAWAAPPTPRHRRSLGARLGNLLIGASGPFGHADSHLADLRELVKRQADQEGREPRSWKKRSR